MSEQEQTEVVQCIHKPSLFLCFVGVSSDIFGFRRHITDNDVFIIEISACVSF